MTVDLELRKTSPPLCDGKYAAVRLLKEAFAMRRSSLGPKSAPTLEAIDEVTLRTKNSGPPAVGPGFMRRSCTFVTEGSWRKNSFGLGSGQKETKDRVNLALQVRKKAAQLGSCEEEEGEISGPHNSSVSSRSGRVSRFVGNLKSWSSSDDVRQSVVGAFTKTVNVIKQRPVSKKVKEALTKSNSSDSNDSKKISHEKSKVAPTISVPPAQSKPRKPKESLKNGMEKGKTTTDSKVVKHMPNKTPVPKKKKVLNKGVQPSSNSSSSSNSNKSTAKSDSVTKDKKWLRHLHDAQASYNAREGRNRRPHPTPHIPDSEESAPSTDLRDVEDGVDADNPESVEGTKPENADGSFNSNSAAPQSSSSLDSLAKKTELLRRKDLKIRQELEEKQNLIADILNIPHHDFESVADMAGEVGLSNQEPRELLLGAIYHAKKLQDTLNDAHSIRDSDIIAAQACSDSVAKSSLPFCHTSLETMDKLNNIAGFLTQYLNSLMTLISERDEERERMRKELVSSREQIHNLHIQQQTLLQEQSASSGALSESQMHSSQLSISPSIITTSVVASTVETVTPHSSRPSSFVSANSSGADQSELTDQQTTDEEGRNEDVSSVEVQSQSQLCLEKGEGNSSMIGEKTGTNSGTNSAPIKEQQSEEAGST